MTRTIRRRYFSGDQLLPCSAALWGRSSSLDGLRLRAGAASDWHGRGHDWAVAVSWPAISTSCELPQRAVKPDSYLCWPAFLGRSAAADAGPCHVQLIVGETEAARWSVSHGSEAAGWFSLRASRRVFISTFGVRISIPLLIRGVKELDAKELPAD